MLSTLGAKHYGDVFYSLLSDQVAYLLILSPSFQLDRGLDIGGET